MKTKPLIFVFFLCPLIIISVMAIDSSKVGETENSKNKIGVERVEDGHNGDHEGGNVDGLFENIIHRMVDKLLGGGKRREARRGRNRGNWGGGNEYSSVRGGYEGPGGGYEGRGGEEGGWEAGVHEENFERGENEEPGLG
ncbi:hypothetical protein MtrunA17_Chr4g0033101 [Medicago truncatula]|uniref:Nodule-specific Glycine Rich Peptide n=2 Tax=Medicago truncatula TaxID=3880 RepID=A0A072UKI7_MEDTR|nr:glycine-rich protein 3 [Medicago truncatula]KEH30264.1 Nodule-specific Glycine Rich Peptide [Medicago truncatula]RHN61110.1 hypothetical protein MtrunA17_Chr4g0033101 [Medicago truncatula]